MARLVEGPHTSDLVPPPDDAVRKRVEQQLPQLTALYFGTRARPVVGLVEQYGSRPVEDPVGLAALQHEAAELPGQPGCRERWLAVPGVDVEHAALSARGRRGVRFIDRDRNAVHVQDAGQRKAAEASPDDRDRCRHLVLQR